MQYRQPMQRWKSIITMPSRPFEGGLGGAHADTRRVGAVVAQHHKGLLLESLGHVSGFPGRESVFEMLGPDPLDLFLDVADFRDVVDLVAGEHAVFAALLALFPALLHVHDHGPLLPMQGSCGQGIRPGGGSGGARGVGRERVDGRPHTQAERTDSSQLQEASSASFHHLVSFGPAQHGRSSSRG